MKKIIMFLFSFLFKKDYGKWYRWQFLCLPWREEWSKEEADLDAIVVIPLRRKHDSGFRCMNFVAIRDRKPICLLSGCSDVIHFDGIGGYGYDWLNRSHTVPRLVSPKDFNIDCLSRSGLLRIFSSSYLLIAGSSLSSFELYAEPRRLTK